MKGSSKINFAVYTFYRIKSFSQANGGNAQKSTKKKKLLKGQTRSPTNVTNLEQVLIEKQEHHNQA